MPCVNAQGILLLYEHTYKRHSGGLIAPRLSVPKYAI